MAGAALPMLLKAGGAVIANPIVRQMAVNAALAGTAYAMDKGVPKAARFASKKIKKVRGGKKVGVLLDKTTKFYEKNPVVNAAKLATYQVAAHKLDKRSRKAKAVGRVMSGLGNQWANGV